MTRLNRPRAIMFTLSAIHTVVFNCEFAGFTSNCDSISDGIIGLEFCKFTIIENVPIGRRFFQSPSQSIQKTLF